LLNNNRITFPLSHTYVQLVLTHVTLATWSSITPWLAKPIRGFGFGAADAPCGPVAGSPWSRREKKSKLVVFLFDGLAGVAGGGLFEFDLRPVKQVFPLAAVFVGKVLLSNCSFAYVVSLSYFMPHNRCASSAIRLFRFTNLLALALHHWLSSSPWFFRIRAMLTQAGPAPSCDHVPPGCFPSLSYTSELGIYRCRCRLFSFRCGVLTFLLTLRPLLSCQRPDIPVLTSPHIPHHKSRSHLPGRHTYKRGML
jgi:hypothetical protein